MVVSFPGSAKSCNQFPVQRIRSAGGPGGSPELRNQPIHIVCAYAHWPADAGGVQASLVGSPPQSRNPNLICVPVPRSGKLRFGVEFKVVIYSMFSGNDSGDEGGVGGIGHRGPNSNHALCIRSVAHQTGEIRQLQALCIGLQNVLRLHAIDRDHQNGSSRDWLNGSGHQRENQHAENAARR